MQSQTDKSQELTIKDMYEGAYLLCRGLELKDLTIVGNNGKKLVTFTFTGHQIEEISEEYRTGRATVNLALFKFTMEKLKDRMFALIREKEKAENRRKEKCLDYQKRKKQKRKTTLKR